MVAGAHPVPLLPRDLAHELGAVAVEAAPRGKAAGQRPLQLVGPVKVAFSDPSEEKIAAIHAYA
jgi:hypothetical protein